MQDASYYRKEFPKNSRNLKVEIFMNKLNYFKTIIALIGISQPKEWIKKDDFEPISISLREIFIDESFNITYGISQDKRRKFEPDDDYFSRHIMDTINMVFEEFGYHIESKQKQINKIRFSICHLEFDKMIKKYLENRHSNSV